jgi:hypothetical protein
MPIHLIPLVISSAFLLVTECFTHVITTLDIMSGNAIFEKVPILPCPTNGHRRKSELPEYPMPSMTVSLTTE